MTRKKLDVSSIPVESLVEFDACTRCGECAELCPTGGEADGDERRTPRGKIRNLKKVIRTQRNPIRKALAGEEKINKMIDELARDCYECSVCGMCGEACPLSLRTIEMWESVRESLVESGLGPMQAHEALVKSIENYDNPWMQPRTQRGRWAKAFPEIADATREPVDVLFYVGCTASYDPEIVKVAENLARIASAAGLKLGILGKNERCCGSTLMRLGEVGKARKLAAENIKTFESTKAKRIVTACSGCYKALSQDYGMMTGKALPVVHAVEFILELVKSGAVRFKDEGGRTIATYHDPCHLGRHTKVYDAPRELLRSLPGIELVEMERNRERSRCCGAGGGLKTLDPELTLKIAKLRIDDAIKAGASVLATACPFCEQTLGEAAKQMSAAIRVADVTELAAERLRPR